MRSEIELFLVVNTRVFWWILEYRMTAFMNLDAWGMSCQESECFGSSYHNSSTESNFLLQVNGSMVF